MIKQDNEAFRDQLRNAMSELSTIIISKYPDGKTRELAPKAIEAVVYGLTLEEVTCA